MTDKKLIPIIGVDQVGIIRDTPAHALPPNAWSDGRNIFFKDGTVHKRPGTVRAFPDIDANVDLRIAHLAYWPNPDQRVYVEVVRDTRDGSATDDQFIFRILTAEGNRIDVNIPAGATIPIGNIADRDWQTSLFAGGHDLIINNNRFAPGYIDRTDNGTTVSFDLRQLLNWDYNPPATPADTALAARVIRGVGNRMLAGNLTRYDNSDDSIVTNFPGTLRVSSFPADLGLVPATWNPADTANPGADEFEISNSSPIVDIVPLQGQALVYTTDSIHSVTFQGLDAVARTVAEGYGALVTGAVLEFDGRHFVVGSNDIYIFGGHPGSIQSVADAKVRNFFFNDINPLQEVQERMFILRDSERDEIQIYYPSILSTAEADRYLAWNYRNNTWTINDTAGAVTGTVGPIRGGGIANTQFSVDGRDVGTPIPAPVANTVEAATQERQTITIAPTTLDAPRPEIQSFTFEGTDAATFDEEEFTIAVENNIFPGNPEMLTFTFPVDFNSGAALQTLDQDSMGEDANVAGVGIDLDIVDNFVPAVTGTQTGNAVTAMAGEALLTGSTPAIAGTIVVTSDFVAEIAATASGSGALSPMGGFQLASGGVDQGGNVEITRVNRQGLGGNTGGIFTGGTTADATQDITDTDTGSGLTIGTARRVQDDQRSPQIDRNLSRAPAGDFPLTVSQTGRDDTVITRTARAQATGTNTFTFGAEGTNVQCCCYEP